MRSPPSLALLLAAPLLACFSDGGSTSLVTAAGATTGSSGGPGSSGEPGTTTTQASTGTSTDAPTTTDASSIGMSSTGVLAECEPNAECQAGAVETGAQCDSCGVQRRTCQADCTWTPMTCEQDLDTCAYWRLPTGAQAWERVAVDPAATFAPKEPVLAVVALPPQQQIYVLTVSSYHILETVTQTWVTAGERDVLFPALAGRTLKHGGSFTDPQSFTHVTMVADADVFAFSYVAADGSFHFDAQLPCCGDDWAGPNAPPDPFAVRGGWGHLGDAEGWIPGDVQALCPEEMPAFLYGYSVSIGDGVVYPQDIGYCFDFYAPVPFDQFLPFTYPGRPDNPLIAGAAWADGLWIWRGA